MIVVGPSERQTALALRLQLGVPRVEARDNGGVRRLPMAVRIINVPTSGSDALRAASGGASPEIVERAVEGYMLKDASVGLLLYLQAATTRCTRSQPKFSRRSRSATTRSTRTCCWRHRAKLAAA